MQGHVEGRAKTETFDELMGGGLTWSSKGGLSSRDQPRLVGCPFPAEQRPATEPPSPPSTLLAQRATSRKHDTCFESQPVSPIVSTAAIDPFHAALERCGSRSHYRLPSSVRNPS